MTEPVHVEVIETAQANCVGASSMKVFKNKIDRYLRRRVTHRIKIVGALGEPIASLSTYHLFFLALDGNLVKFF